MQYLIGPLSPTFAGIGLPGGRAAVTPRSPRSGLEAKACLLYAASSSGAGEGMMLSVPWNRPAMYSSSGSVPRFGLGPWRLALGVIPLPLATRSFLLSGSYRTEVGYHPTGINPSGLASPGSATLKTATLLASALATNRSFPSGVRARLLGVLPAGELGYSPASRVCTALPVRVSRTLTRVELEQATKRVLPSGASANSVGCFSVGQRATTFFSFTSRTATAAAFHRLTNSRPPAGSARQA